MDVNNQSHVQINLAARTNTTTPPAEPSTERLRNMQRRENILTKRINNLTMRINQRVSIKQLNHLQEN
tara:strand:+ start:556 stop:759 length:204 start_codon:yes stop_codon:yes gene_type:complete